MPETVVKVGPADHGLRMSLRDFDTAEPQPGYLYELSRGIVIVSDVPDRRHLAQVDEVRQQLSVYRAMHRGSIYTIAAGSDCKLLIVDEESERHPDVTVYKHPPADDDDLWANWVPEIVIEVVSRSSVERDYIDKQKEYLLFGVREYWIVDANRREVLVLRRRGQRWTEAVVQPPDVVATKLLAGFALNCAAVFEAADAVGGR
jgi:Uma2 family endonuclease